MQSYFYDCKIFFDGCLHGTYVYIFNISTNVTIIRSTTMYFHLIHYTLKLTLPLEGAISTIAFKVLGTLIIPRFFKCYFY